jgi:hypothetical protein
MPETRPVQSTPIQSAGAQPAPPAQSSAPSLEFRALLERLREQAAALERASDKPLGADDLSLAVRDAEASLTGALSLAEGLLESYRASRVAS